MAQTAANKRYQLVGLHPRNHTKSTSPEKCCILQQRTRRRKMRGGTHSREFKLTTSVPSLKRSHIIGVLSILLILLVLPLTVFFSQKQQEYRQHAAGNTNCGVTKN